MDLQVGSNISLTYDGLIEPSESVVKILLMSVSGLGLVTNCMTVIVLSQLRASHPIGGGERSARFNLLGLAVADFCICLTTLPLIYTKRVFKKNDILFYYTLVGPGLVSSFLTVSAWMVVLLSILRYLAVCWPLKSRFYLRYKCVIKTICSLYASAFVFNLPIFLRYDYEEIETRDENGTNDKFFHIADRIYPYSELLKDIYSIAHIICTNVGPFSVVLVTNISVIVACRKSEKISGNFRSLENAKGSHQPTSSSASLPNDAPQDISQVNNVSNSDDPVRTKRKNAMTRFRTLRPRALHRVTPLLLAVIFAFLLLSTPFGIVQFICLKLIDTIGYRIRESDQFIRQYFILNSLIEWSNFFQVFGCAANFFLYFMVSQTFRRTTKRTLRQIFQRFCRKKGIGHLCAYMCSVCCCEERRSCKNEAYIVRVYSPIECRNHQRYRRTIKSTSPYHEKQQLASRVELRHQP